MISEKKDEKVKIRTITLSSWWFFIYSKIAIALTLWFCSNGLPFIYLIIVWLDFQVNFSIFKTDFSPTTPAQGKVKLVPARATILFMGRLSASVWWETNEIGKNVFSCVFYHVCSLKVLCIAMLRQRVSLCLGRGQKVSQLSAGLLKSSWET